MLISGNKRLLRELKSASSYAEWQQAAIALDENNGSARWRRLDTSTSFDFVSIRRRLDKLRELRAKHDYLGLLYTLNEGIHGNMGGMGRSRLYQRAASGTKHVIEEYIEEITDALRLIASVDIEGITAAEKREFFKRAYQCFGQSAFMMSGSGMLLYFHVGVVKTLLEHDLLPSVISGSSGGAVVGTMLATHSDAELVQLFDPETLVNEIETEKRRLSVLRKIRPTVLQIEEVKAIIERLIPDLTFQEALSLTGRHMNVSVAPAETHQTSRLLNAITSPTVYVREAVMASAAVPGVYPPVTLAAKNKQGERNPFLPSRKWVDGAISDDLPAKRLARLYGVNHYIVSQTNPHVIPFVSDTKRSHDVTSVIKQAATRTAREWLNASATLMHKPLSKRPRLNQITNTVLSVLNQDYMGDINILPPFRVHNPTKLLAHLSINEIMQLIAMGEKATWPKLEMIRIQTKIGKTLADIVDAQG